MSSVFMNAIDGCLLSSAPPLSKPLCIIRASPRKREDYSLLPVLRVLLTNAAARPPFAMLGPWEPLPNTLSAAAFSSF